MIAAGNFKNSSFLWWLIRPSNKYPTIELRICDSCTKVEDALAIATLYRCLVRAVTRRPMINDGYGPLHRAIAAENMWQAQRLGIGARFISATTGEVSSVSNALDVALALIDEDADALSCRDWMKRTQAIAAYGSSADRQLAVFREAKAHGADDALGLRKVVGHLVDESVA